MIAGQNYGSCNSQGIEYKGTGPAAHHRHGAQHPESTG